MVVVIRSERTIEGVPALKKFLLILSFFVTQLAIAQTWVQSTQIYTALDNTKNPVPVFSNSWTGQGIPADGNWYTVDLKPYGVPADAKAAFLSGILIVSHGDFAGTVNMYINLRAPNSSVPCANALGQVVDAFVGGGQRSGFSSWVPLVNGQFQVCLLPTPTPVAQSWPAIGANLSLQAWTK